MFSSQFIEIKGGTLLDKLISNGEEVKICRFSITISSDNSVNSNLFYSNNESIFVSKNDTLILKKKEHIKQAMTRFAELFNRIQNSN